MGFVGEAAQQDGSELEALGAGVLVLVHCCDCERPAELGR